MARRKAVEAPARPVSGPDAPAPLEILRCPATRWDSTDRSPARFEEWLRARQEWRETHTEPLRGLFGRDRLALSQFTDAGQLDPATVAAELAALQASAP